MSILARISFTLLALSTVALSGVFMGCDVKSGNDIVRRTSIDFSGVYRNENGRIVTENTGTTVTELNLRQNGDRLEAIDNNGLIFRGSLGSVGDTSASFNLSGATTVGQEVAISGTISGEGSAATMRGNWIEPSLTALLFATAAISPIATNAPPANGGDGAGLTIQPAGNISVSINNTVTFTADGGSENYRWAVSNQNLGFLSNSSGTTVVYTPSRNGTQRVTLSDGEETVTTTVTH